MDQNADVQIPTQEDIRLDLRARCLAAIRVTLETLLEEELAAMIGAGRHERSRGRRDQRNGFYERELVTSMGSIELAVPRSRNTGSPTGVIGRYRRRTDELDDAISEAYVSGVSTRKMSDVTTALLGEAVGRSTVSRVSKRLDENVEALRNSRIEGPIHYLYLDATFVDARWARAVENVSALVAYGIGDDGHRQLLAVTLGPQESEDTWAELIKQLLDRGLSGVKLVIADDHRGLEKAVRRLLPEAKQQRCVVHFERNIIGKVPHRLRPRVAREVSSIFSAASEEQAKKKLERFKETLGKQVPEALECLTNGFKAATVFFLFPKEHWTRIRSTNSLERLHGEIKRRTRAVGAFPDRASALRLITSVAIHATRIWTDRRYLDMSLLEKTGEKEAA